MATVRLQNNILEEKVDTFSVKSGTTIESIIREHTDGNSYEGTMVECYDLDTGKTYFANIENDTAVTNAIVQVNGKDVGLDYEVTETDIVAIVITPAGGGGGGWDWVGAFWGGIAGALTGALYGFSVGGAFGAVVGGLIGLGVGFVAGGILVGSIKQDMEAQGNKTASKGIDSEALPDVRGATNQPLVGQSYPFVLGKHLATPFIIGSPWNEITGLHGETNYIHVLYAVGYAPLRLTDFKLGDMFLAHNQRWSGNQGMSNVFHGQLHGIDPAAGSGSDVGDIVNTWKNNDITLEILQQGQSGEYIDYGTVYPYAKVQQDINANVLYIADGTLQEIDSGNNISYKGLGLANGLRNNPIRFTEQFAKSARVELDFSNGLYKNRSETKDKKSEVKYYQIPMWVAIQWRVYSEGNPKADGGDSGSLPIPSYDYEHNVYTSNQRGWYSFPSVNGISATTFSEADRNNDIDAHTGNHLFVEQEVTHEVEVPDSTSEGYTDPSTGTYHSGGGTHTETRTEKIKTRSDINRGWIGGTIFNLEGLGGTNSNKEGINEFRCIASVDFVDWAYYNLLTDAERNSGDQDIFAKKFKAFFFDSSNTTKSIEVRVVRISPCYIDETVSDKEKSAFQFNDVFTWKTLTSEVLDGNKLTKNNQIVQKRPMPEDKMRKLCVVALKAKTDTVDQLSNTLKKFSCVAQSFAPYYDEEQKKWLPERVSKVTKYHAPFKPDTQDPPRWIPNQEISEQQFYNFRQEGIKATRSAAGNDFTSQIVTRVIRTNEHLDSRGRFIIPYDSTMNYCTNNVASMFILACIGPHLGVDALGYEQKFYDERTHQLMSDAGDLNMTALAKWYKESREVIDGSKYTSDGTHYNERGEQVPHSKDELVKVFFAANAYIYQPELLESMLSKITIAGRAVFTRDNKGRLTVIMDKKEEYPVALINQQNTIQSSYTISFADLPSGLQISFPDENDGYMQNDIFCMVDGETEDNPRGAIEAYGFSYVTNPTQLYSLGRYLLANRILNREVVTKKLGIEGASIGLGNLVLVSDDTMLIGTDTGGRITKLIETDTLIYGFVINNTYHYTGEEEVVNGVSKCKQGVVVLQPSQYKESRVITLRLAKLGTAFVVDGVTYRAKKGNTNVVLFDTPISKISNNADGSDYYIYKPQVDNIVSFGIIGQITSTYRVVKIKSDAKRHFEFTLMKYQEELYEYGRELPSFQNNMTVPDRSGEDAFALSQNVTHTELIKALSDASALTQSIIDETFGNVPPVPSSLNADVKENCIQLTCIVNNTSVNNVDHIVYEIKRPDGSTAVINGSYSTEYFFNRVLDGYPEKDDLRNWQVRAKSVSIYLDQYDHNIESEWSSYVNISNSSLAAYGTWIPPIPTIIGFKAHEDGINAEWSCDLTGVYGTVHYDVTTYYGNSIAGTQTVVDKTAVYLFNRAIDGFPEKPNTEGMTFGTRTLDDYHVKVRARNIVSGSVNDSLTFDCDYSMYKTWIPAKPIISPRVVNRNITLQLSQGADCYGVIDYLIGVRNEKDPFDTFYVPDTETNPYSRESAYKLYRNGTFVEGKLETTYQYSQSMPLEAQNGFYAGLDTDDDPEVTKALAVPTNAAEEKIILLDRAGFSPIDTSYQFEVYAFNRTVENYYDNISPTPVDHRYDVTTYHKVSTAYARKLVTALATSVRDILNGAIVSDKIARGAITETKIEDDAISTPKLQANAVVADKMYTYNMITLNHGTHVLSGYGWDNNDDYMQNLISDIRTGKKSPTELDELIKRKSMSYWLGLDGDKPEFYLGDHLVAEKNYEDANYFHYFWEGNEANLDIKLSNFIVTALSSTIKGFFNVRNKKGDKFGGANSFLRVNPEYAPEYGEVTEGYLYNNQFYEDYAHTTLISPDTWTTYKDKSTALYYQWKSDIGYYRATATNAETMIIKGDVLISTKNSNGQNGTFTVQGSASVGSLSIGGDSSVTGGLTVSGESQLSNVTVGKNQDGLRRNLTVNGTTTSLHLSVTNSTNLANMLFVNHQYVSSGYHVQVGSDNNQKNLKVFGELKVEGDSNLNNVNIGVFQTNPKDLYVSNNTTISGALAVGGSTTLYGTLSVNNITSVSGGTVYADNFHATGKLSGARVVIPNGRPSSVGIGDIWVV